MTSEVDPMITPLFAVGSAVALLAAPLGAQSVAAPGQAAATPPSEVNDGTFTITREHDPPPCKLLGTCRVSRDRKRL